MTSKLQCEYLKNGTCFSIMTNDEAREARLINCRNSNIQACCYLCTHHQICEISCKKLGLNRQEINNNQLEDSAIQFLHCSSCNIPMASSRITLKIEGLQGTTKNIDLKLDLIRENSGENLPLIMHICPKCGKIEFVAPEKTKQKMIDKHLFY